jgi:hypothetical protein
MGNRVLVVFTDGQQYSPFVYLHWHASQLGALLTKWRERMQGREGDPEYGAARFVGVCHDHIEGNLSLGIWNGPVSRAHAQSDTAAMIDELLREGNSVGDAGVVLVDVNTNTIRRMSKDRVECPLEDGWKIPAPAPAKEPTP